MMARFFVLVLVVASLLVIPCGGARPEATAKRQIKIGFLQPLTGPFAQSAQDQIRGFKLYLNEIGNKVEGRAIEVVIEDTETNPATGLTKARKLVEQHKVDIVAGIISDAVGYAVAPYIIEQKVPLVLTIASGDKQTKKLFNRYVFRASYSNSQLSHPLGEWLFKHGHRNIALVGLEYAWGYETLGGVAKTFIEQGGRVVQEIYVPLGMFDFMPYTMAVKPQADAVVGIFGGSLALNFVRAYQEAGLKRRIPLFGTVLTEESILPEEGEAALGAVTVLNYARTGTSVNRRFLENYKAAYNIEVSFVAEQSYTGARMIVEAIKAVRGNIEDKDAFLDALEKVEFEAPRGPFKLDKFHNPVQNVYIRKVVRSDGKLENKVIDTISRVSQFWKWSPDEFMKFPDYSDMGGKWSTYRP